MITFERTRDWPTIKRIVTHAKIYSAVSDDFSPLPDKWEPIQDESLWYVLVRDDEELIGMWMFQARNVICWDVHTCLLPSAWGPKAREAVHGMVQWIWDNTCCLRLITEVPAYNRLALNFAIAAGMEEFGRNPRSYMKYGRLHDVILLGMSKPGVH